MKRTSDAMKIVAVLALTMCLALLNCAPVENEDLRDLKIIGLNGEEISAGLSSKERSPKAFFNPPVRPINLPSTKIRAFPPGAG